MADLRYGVRFVHKINNPSNDPAGDGWVEADPSSIRRDRKGEKGAWFGPLNLADLRKFLAKLRYATDGGPDYPGMQATKGALVWPYSTVGGRIESDGRIVMFMPDNSSWHSLILTPESVVRAGPRVTL